MAPLKQEQISFRSRKLRSSSVPSNKLSPCDDAENVAPPAKSSPAKRKQQTPAKKDEESLLHSPAKSPRKTLGELTSNNVLRTPPPSSSKRQLSFGGPGGGDSRMSAAKQSLSTAVPDEVVGREKEVDALKDFLENAWKGSKRRTRSLYISGAPGTGKTACLKSCLSDFTSAEGDKKRVQEVFINCMGVANSKDIFGKIAVALDKNYDGCQPKKFVEAKICGSKGRPLLLVLDEIDQLDCRSHEILYSIFEWPYLKKSRLVLIGIANALDLTDRILPRLKLSASITPRQLSFPAYTKEQINDIIVARLQQECCGTGGEPVIKPIAVKFLASKIAAISGDVRKALDVCRRAIELAEIECQKQRILGGSSGGDQAVKQIDLPQILAIFNQVYSSRANSSLKESNSDLPLQQKILVASLLLMSNYGARKCKEASLGKLQETYGRVCKKRQMASLDLGEVSSLCSLLEARGFLNVKRSSSSKSIRESKISLRIDEKEVEAALQDKTLLTDILTDTTCIAQ